MSFRSLRLLFHPLLCSSSFLGGPSSKTMIPTASGTTVQPIFSPHLQQHPTSTLTGLTRSDHGKVERAIAIAMLTIIPSSFVFNTVLMNYLLAISLAIHAHWGMDTVLSDYCPRKALPLANIIRYFLTTISFAGLCYFNYHDMGLIKALKALWTLY